MALAGGLNIGTPIGTAPRSRNRTAGVQAGAPARSGAPTDTTQVSGGWTNRASHTIGNGFRSLDRLINGNGTLSDLRRIDDGTMVPDPNSRLGAYYATRGYEPGTVGHATHNAIGTIYASMGTVGEEQIGRVFNSPEARATYDQPVDGPASRRMAEMEHKYWETTRQQNPWSVGGNLGSAFGPGARDWLQQNIFGGN